MGLSPLSGEAKRLFKSMGLSDELAVLQRAWDAEMGGFAAMARIVALDNKALVIEVHSSPAMQELSLRRRELVRRLNRYFQDPFVDQITVKMAGTDGN